MCCVSIKFYFAHAARVFHSLIVLFSFNYYRTFAGRARIQKKPSVFINTFFCFFYRCRVGKIIFIRYGDSVQLGVLNAFVGTRFEDIDTYVVCSLLVRFSRNRAKRRVLNGIVRVKQERTSKRTRVTPDKRVPPECRNTLGLIIVGAYVCEPFD